MSSILFWGAVCVFGPFVYVLLGGETHEVRRESSNDHYKRYEDETYEYFSNLPLDYQQQYFSENLDLRYYKDDNRVGFTNDKNRNAQHAAEISRITGKPFTNKNKTY